MQHDQTGYAVIATGMVAIWGIVVFLAATMRPRGPRLWTVLALAFTGICILVQVLAILAAWQLLGEALALAGTLAGLAAITAATIYALRKRQPATFDTGPVTPRNFVGGGKTYAWGEWNHNDVKTARANASRIRKGVRA